MLREGCDTEKRKGLLNEADNRVRIAVLLCACPPPPMHPGAFAEPEPPAARYTILIIARIGATPCTLS